MWELAILLLWFLFLILINSDEFSVTEFLCICNINFYFIYKINFHKNVYVSLRLILLLICIPSCIMWYVFITNNYFLKIEPAPYITVVYIMFFYFYIFLYLFSEFKKL